MSQPCPALGCPPKGTRRLCNHLLLPSSTLAGPDPTRISAWLGSRLVLCLSIRTAHLLLGRRGSYLEVGFGTHPPRYKISDPVIATRH
jgi:hypothetical protein